MDNVHIQRLACGHVICSTDRRDALDATWFDRNYWEDAGAQRHTSTGRSPVLMGIWGTETWVLRHYSRGGLVARFIDDHYFWAGLERTRAFREFRLLAKMREWRLPVPAPIAACVQRSGLVYKADIITALIPDTVTLSALLRRDGAAKQVWQSIGRMVSDFHAYGIDHPDLTAHNILVDDKDDVFLVDFDNAVLRPRGDWRQRGIARLERSLRKVALEFGVAFSDEAWRALISEYDPRT